MEAEKDLSIMAAILIIILLPTSLVFVGGVVSGEIDLEDIYDSIRDRFKKSITYVVYFNRNISIDKITSIQISSSAKVIYYDTNIRLMVFTTKNEDVIRHLLNNRAYAIESVKHLINDTNITIEQIIKNRQNDMAVKVLTEVDSVKEEPIYQIDDYDPSLHN